MLARLLLDIGQRLLLLLAQVGLQFLFVAETLREKPVEMSFKQRDNRKEMRKLKCTMYQRPRDS